MGHVRRRPAGRARPPGYRPVPGAGIDDYHPTEIGRQIAALAPAAEVLEPWKDSPGHVAKATESVRRFLLDHAD